MVKKPIYEELEERVRELEKENIDLKQSERLLRERDQKLKELLSVSPVTIYRCEPKDNFPATFITENVRNQLGYEPYEFTGEADFWASHIHPDDAPHILSNLTSLFEKGYHTHEYRFLHKDGTYRWMYDELRLIYDVDGKPKDIVGNLMDITERKRLKEALRDSRNMLRSVLDSIPSPVFWKDRDSIYLGGNRTWLEAAGLKSSEEVVGKSDYDLPWQREQADSFRENDTSVMESGIPEYGIIEPYLRADGTRAWAKTNKVPLRDTEGNVTGVLGTYEDITEQVRAEEVQRISHSFLVIANRHMEMSPLLKEFVVEVQNFTRCAAVGLRMLDEEGNIPYEAYAGFSRTFYESESPLSIKSDQCMCINVIKGVTETKHSFYTEGGSFYMNGTTRFLATVSEEEKGRTRNVCNQVGYESVALVPIRVENHILGLIHVADPRENMCPLEVVEVLEGAAMQLGTATYRVRAEEALRKVHDELEQRVAERTRDLARVNEELRRLSSMLMTAQEDERKRIASDIHDSIGSCLAAAKYEVESALQQIRKTPEAVTESLDSIVLRIQEAVNECRRMQMDLRPSMIDDLGLFPTISWFCRTFEQTYPGIRIEQKIDIAEGDILEPLKIVIYRVTQEAMNNIAKHSKADLVRFSLRKRDDVMELVFQDNGRGFSLEKINSQRATMKGLGLMSMRERIELSGGSFNIESGEGKGTIISASWPFCKKG